MQIKTISGRLYYLPETYNDVKAVLRTAKKEGKTVVVRGAGHSFPFSPLTQEEPDCLLVLLTYLNKIVRSDWEKGKFTVQAGCHLGFDPLDPLKVSTEENAFLFQLDPVTPQGRRNTPPGWTAGDLGGIIHQTIGGFMATGSSGGSLTYAFEDAITAVKVMYHGVDDVEEQTFFRPADGNPDDPFWAIGYAHLGLMGIVVEVTLQCEPAYNIRGSETVSSLANCSVDLFGGGSDDKPSLQQFLTQTEYTRLLWWPQKGIQKAVLWKAQRSNAADWQTFIPKPYQEVPALKPFPNLVQRLVGALFTLLNAVYNFLTGLLDKWFGKTPAERNRIDEDVAAGDERLLQGMLKMFAAPGVQTFWDVGWRGIPMDNHMSDVYIPTWFTELWIDLSRTQELMQCLQQFYKDPLNCGTYCIEIYAAKKSPFWLSPSYGRDVVRVDVFWFARNTADPVQYFSRYWQHLAAFDFRCHWGKYLPPATGSQGAAYLKAQYPQWEAFLALRQKMDPYNLLLNRYWQQHLQIELPTAAVI